MAGRSIGDHVWVHFKNPLMVTAAFLCGIFAYIYFSLARYDDQDKSAYQLLVNGNKKEELDAVLSKQQRIGLQKDIFHPCKELLAMRIKSSQSMLKFVREGNKMEIVEQLEKVVSTIQEELYFLLPGGHEIAFDAQGNMQMRNGNYATLLDAVQEFFWSLPIQTVFSLQAEQGSYSYKDSHLSAENVDISRILALGHTLDEPLYIWTQLSNGSLNKMDLFLDNQAINFKGSDFKAKLYGSFGEWR